MEQKLQNFKVENQTDMMMMQDYNMLMSSMHVSVSKHLMDEYFTVIWANDYFYERTLYTKEEYEAIYQNRCSDYFKQDPEEYAKFAQAIASAIADGAAGYESICKMPQKGGTHIWIKITGTFTKEKVNGIPVIYSVFTDVTEAVEQKQLQKQLEERTAQLSNALKLAEAANRGKTDFLSRMSHDIRTPMNAIIGMTDIATAHLHDAEKVGDCLRKISLSSQHLLGLINDVLDMSKIESGKMTLAENDISLPEVMENIVAIMQPGVKEKNQQFDVHLRNIRHERYCCDSLRLRQVLINVLSNASKFTPDGGKISFAIEELPGDPPGYSQLKFTISDTGIGIKPEFLAHIFDSFTRERDSRVDKTEGSGLGMAISKRIIELMGGTIDVSSKPGQGTTFIVRVKLKTAEAPTDDFRFPPLKIIVVDDNDMVCAHTVQLLHEIGIEADWETNGATAVKKIVNACRIGNGYDALILDWKMPEQDGMQTVQLLRKQMGTKLTILIMSAYDWSDIKEDAVAAGVNGFITKPVFLSTLCHRLRKYVLDQGEPADDWAKTNSLEGRRFLLVEDNDLNREIAIELLSSSGATVEYACNGAQSVDKFAQSSEHYYDLILMDIQMPVMSGYDATRRIRLLSRNDAKSIPIIAMTADAFSEDVNAAKQAGMNGHLAKPIDRTTMVREINKYLSASS